MSEKVVNFRLIVDNFYLIDYGAFLINIVQQPSSFMVLTDLNCGVKLLDSGFSFEAAHRLCSGHKNKKY